MGRERGKGEERKRKSASKEGNGREENEEGNPGNEYMKGGE